MLRRNQKEDHRLVWHSLVKSGSNKILIRCRRNKYLLLMILLGKAADKESIIGIYRRRRLIMERNHFIGLVD